MVHNTKIFGKDKPNQSNNYNFNLRPYNTGDSCSDFALTIIRMLSNGYRGEPTDSYDKKAKDKTLDDYGLYLHNTYAKIMYGIVEGEIKDRHGAVGSLSFERAMTRLGWKKIYVTEDMTIDDLEVGDLLVSKDHVEFYVGLRYASEYYDTRNGNKNDWKKSGTKVIHDTYGPHRSLVSGDKAEGTFGWGGVHDEFPVESKDGQYTYFYKNSDEPYYRLCQCGLEIADPYASHAGHVCDYGNPNCQYEIIWRKK